ncbi:MAG: glycosyltransferase, partial [candidate division NC10 bacterium]|nr:glycosyltransferase [candidate division NC10 bacterium]
AVTFAGEQADVRPWLHRMALYVQPSIAEGMSNSILEAMACGLPVVATRVGGTPEVVEDGVSGLLVPPEDPAAMAKALVTLLRDPPRCAAMGDAGRNRVAREFTETEMIRRTTAFLDALVDAAHLRPPTHPVGVAAQKG